MGERRRGVKALSHGSELRDAIECTYRLIEIEGCGGSSRVPWPGQVLTCLLSGPNELLLLKSASQFTLLIVPSGQHRPRQCVFGFSNATATPLHLCFRVTRGHTRSSPDERASRHQPSKSTLSQRSRSTASIVASMSAMESPMSADECTGFGPEHDDPCLATGRGRSLRMSIVRPVLKYGKCSSTLLLLSRSAGRETKAVPEVTTLHTRTAEVDEMFEVCLGVYEDVRGLREVRSR